MTPDEIMDKFEEFYTKFKKTERWDELPGREKFFMRLAAWQAWKAAMAEFGEIVEH